MTEKFVQFVWKHQLFQKSSLIGRGGEKIQIVFPGYQNSNSGPDFNEAQLIVDEIKWIGSIEIHIKESDWMNHKHHLDKNYDNIILHVVFEEDHHINTNSPTLCIAPHINSGLIEAHEEMMKKEQWIPCENVIKEVNPIYIRSFLDNLLIERIELKINQILKEGNLYNNYWIETAYQIIFANFGFKLNNVNFTLLAKSIPYKVIEENRDNLFRIEALLFGQSGLLNNDYVDEYPILLWHEYCYLREKYQLKPISGHLWKFMRTRPSNFPTIRISQLAMFLQVVESDFLEQICMNDQAWISEKLNALKASTYWESHYHFDKKFKTTITGKFGATSSNIYIINGIVQLIFAFGKFLGNEEYIEKAMQILSSQKSEGNQIISGWAHLKIEAKNAADSQALIHLKNYYCQEKRCLDCGIGYQIMTKGNIAVH